MMTLENLLRIGRLKEHPVEPSEIRKLLKAAERNLKDSGVNGISLETGFDTAYKAIMQTALAALMANGYRPDTKQPGHHMTVLQSLSKSIGLPSERMIILDVLRRKRNLSDYTGEDIDKGSADHCVQEAENLLQGVTAWLARDHAGLLE